MVLTPLAIPSPSWSGLSIGPITIHAYALCIMLGMVAAVLIARKRWRDRGLDPDIVLDAALLAIPLGIVGARLYHVAITDPTYYFGSWEGFREIPLLWHGGLGIMGAVAFGAIGVWIICRRNKVSFATFADCLAPGLLVAQAIGRWGNWFNQELFGSPTTLPWGLEIDPASGNFPAGMPADTLFHPTFLYESIWNLLGAAVLIWLSRSPRTAAADDGGRLFGLYLVWYGLGRMLIELFLRIDPSYMLWGLRIHVYTAAGIILIGAALFVVLGARARRREETSGSARTPGPGSAGPTRLS
ncbi:prolipoprotein diacylglyceryl transferase [Kocuria coralli]|uniref:Phosphatidylglycerol--prolipoprotein diacylglyceryl transferase n=1 Tax=Kocuria coralli TaxID=1461025 RepID=A0A5J5L061_9MICC|nr:prolipoprotein diacylglyceryl transferase [Kocuria coralli]KAA9395008.1 prolipoprotein diacylglyceryl transferase [Kocuria coralli]